MGLSWYNNYSVKFVFNIVVMLKSILILIFKIFKMIIENIVEDIINIVFNMLFVVIICVWCECGE